MSLSCKEDNNCYKHGMSNYKVKRAANNSSLSPVALQKLIHISLAITIVPVSTFPLKTGSISLLPN
jgi:hypothetical protein